MSETPNIQVRVYDNDGETFDRYTAVFEVDGSEDEAPEYSMLGIGETGNVPNGFCMHVEGVEGDHLGELVEVESLPAPVQRAIADEVRGIAHYYRTAKG